MKAPCALVGAELPPAKEGASEPFRIEVGKIRGVESRGMLCSARELKLSDDHEGLLALDDDAPSAPMCARRSPSTTRSSRSSSRPNLGHALSVYGVAREVAAITGAPLVAPTFAKVPVASERTLPVSIEAPDLCGRFSGRVVSGVDARAATPRWMADRLARCGQRTVSPLVDISNYVMFELGRPSHIFDLDKIEGRPHGSLGQEGRVARAPQRQHRRGRRDRRRHRRCEARRVARRHHGRRGDAVSDATRNVYVEAAFWWPEAVAGRSRRYHFSTDAGHRFERGVDPATTVEHIERLTSLILEICGGAETRCGPIDDHVTALPELAPVTCASPAPPR
jgi:phenylalanyl-tRNA synthetase beta chain